MASKLLGRVPCVEPDCGFPSAHIKVNIDVEGKRPYRHCPECGAQYFPRTDRQVKNMISTMRPEGAAPEKDTDASESEAGMPAGPVQVGEPVPAVQQRYKMVFGVKVPV